MRSAPPGTRAPGAIAAPVAGASSGTLAGARNARDYFKWVYANGDAQARQLDYVPLPDALVRQIEAYWAQNLKF